MRVIPVASHSDSKQTNKRSSNSNKRTKGVKVNKTIGHIRKLLSRETINMKLVTPGPLSHPAHL